MENRIKECQLDLFADRTSAASLRANQLILRFASLAYVLMTALRRGETSGSSSPRMLNSVALDLETGGRVKPGHDIGSG